jgi:hypothetical protein
MTGTDDKIRDRETVAQLWVTTAAEERKRLLIGMGFTPAHAAQICTSFWGQISQDDQDAIVANLAG